MKHAYIVYSQFFDRNGEGILIGGIETYIYNLCKVLISTDICPIIYQFANKDFIKEYETIKVVGVKVTSTNYKKNSRILTKKIQEVFDYENDIMIFASEEYVVPFKSKNVVTIQHGISWDIPNGNNVWVNYIKNSLRALIEYRRLDKCSHVICVDYNFLNWYRAVFKKYDYKKFYAIPNFCDTSYIVKDHPKKDNIKIVFARRFVKHRGAILFANVAKRILEKYSDVEICFAGEGACEREMKTILSDCSNVTFTSFTANESIAFHSGFDIAVVPTIGSEGTSLSLLEAMAAGCAVVSTNVGGITNILIDGYNGSIVNATEEDVYSAVERLINDKELRCFYAQKGQEIAKNAFSKKIWESKWLDIINSLK